MRTLCAVLLVVLTAALAALAMAPAAAGAKPPPINASYPWVQPWEMGVVAPDVGHWTQPAASVPIGVQLTEVAGPDASYPWVQPWEIRDGVLPDVGGWTQPPASIPAG